MSAGFFARHPASVYMPSSPSYTRLLATSVDVLWDRGWLTKDSKVGVVGYDTPDARSLLDGEEVVWAFYPTTRNVKNLMRNALLALRVLRRRNVSAVITTGAGVALPFVAVARLKGIPTVYIEVYDRIDTATLTARLCRPFLSAMLVQWEEQRRMYPKATVVGNLL